MSTLNGEQTLVVQTSQEQPLLYVIAGPGAGKTHTLAACIASRPRDETRIVITYTNAAARVLAERLNGIPCGFIGTLHGYCLRLLQRYGDLIGYRKSGVNLLDEKEADALLEATAKRLGCRLSTKKLKERARGSEGVWQAYAFGLRRENLVDFATVLTDGLRLLNDPTIGMEEAVDALYVDETQDSAEIDWEIYDAIVALRKMWMGDLDQSVFRFRGARPDILLARLEQPGICVRTLETCYRSGAAICAAANRLIGHNLDRLEKAMVPLAANGPGSLQVKTYPDGWKERDSVVAAAGRLQRDASVGIILRTNALVDWYRESLLEDGVPVETLEGEGRPFDYDLAIMVLRLWQDPTSDRLALNVMQRRNVAPSTIVACQDESLRTGFPLGRVALSRGAFGHDQSSLTSTPDGLSAANYLAAWGVGPESVELIRQVAATLPQGRPTVTDLLQALATGDRSKLTSRGVCVCTAHGAKGREFDCVFLPAWEEAIVPTTRKDMRPADLEEERRLAFVALTRARKEVTISYAATRLSYGQHTSNQPSRFIAELQ